MGYFASLIIGWVLALWIQACDEHDGWTISFMIFAGLFIVFGITAGYMVIFYGNPAGVP